MPDNYILIDFENVQPTNLELLEKHPFKVLLFVGANQTKVSLELASAMQELGGDAQYIKTSGSGPNALDFHIAYYLGKLASDVPDAHFHVISKDKGFDPLLSHLNKKGVKAQRLNNLAEIPVLRVSASSSLDKKVSIIVNNLISRGQSRPRKVNTLQNTINTLFTPKLDNTELQRIIKALIKKNFITVKDGNVSYTLPKTH